MHKVTAALIALTLSLPRAARGDTKSDCIAAADRGQTLRDSRKLRDARERFLFCASDACPALVRKQCAEWITDVDARTPTVVLVATKAGAEVFAVRVEVDGAPLVDRIGGEALAIDPGAHKFRFTFEGQSIETDVVVREGEKSQRVTVSFAAPPAPTPTPTPTPTAPTPTAPTPTAPTRVDAPAEAPAEKTPFDPSSFGLALALGLHFPSGFLDGGSVNGLLGGGVEGTWHPPGAFDLGLFLDLAGGGVTLNDSVASAAGVTTNAGYGSGGLGLRGRWHMATRASFDVWSGLELETMGETWAFNGAPGTQGKDFHYNDGAVGGGALVGIDFRLSSSMSLGAMTRFFVVRAAQGTRVSCNANCAGDLPGGSSAAHAFADVSARLKWSFGY